MRTPFCVILWGLLIYFGLFVLRSAPPRTGSPGPFGPGTPEESEKSPERVPRAGPQKCRKSAPRSLKRVRKESESQVLDSGRTLLRLRDALFRHFWGPAPGYSFRTLFRLFRDSGPEGPRRPCVGRGRSQYLSPIFFLSGFVQKRPVCGPDVHKIVLSIKSRSPPLLICTVFPHFGPFSGGGQNQILRTRILWTPRLF